MREQEQRAFHTGGTPRGVAVAAVNMGGLVAVFAVHPGATQQHIAVTKFIFETSMSLS
jgi:hypothetical protein